MFIKCLAKLREIIAYLSHFSLPCIQEAVARGILMKPKKSLLFLLTACAVHASEEPLHGITFFSPRSQGSNSAQTLLQWHEIISYEDLQQRHMHTFFATLSYSQSFKAQH